MRISLIGMSGSGKSYWSKKLQQKGFTRFCIDDLIEEKLGDELKKLGYSGIQDVAKWMGQPFEPQYSVSSKKYLQFEKDSLAEVITYLDQAAKDENIVIDTTGSVIYIAKDILQTLAQLTTIIYFETPASVKKEMYQLYLKDPKPVIWGDSFQKKDNEDDMEALTASYPRLLAYRTRQYKALANITFRYQTLHDPQYTAGMLIERILQRSH